MYDHFLMQQLLFYISTKIYARWEKNLFPTPNFPSKKHLVGRTFQIAQNSWRAGLCAQKGWWVEHTSGTPHFGSPAMFNPACGFKTCFFLTFQQMSVCQSFDYLDQKKRSCENWRNNKFQTLLNGFSEKLWRLQTSPSYEWITVKLKDEHPVKQIHKNQTKPEQNFQKLKDLNGHGSDICFTPRHIITLIWTHFHVLGGPVEMHRYAGIYDV